MQRRISITSVVARLRWNKDAQQKDQCCENCLHWDLAILLTLMSGVGSVRYPTQEGFFYRDPGGAIGNLNYSSFIALCASRSKISLGRRFSV
jgi:hypothetical protein